MMDDNIWTVRFPNVPGTNGPAEFQPDTMSLKTERGRFDHCQMDLHWTVGEELKPHTDSGVLSTKSVAEICLNGEPQTTLMFRPDYAQYSSHAAHLEFHDAQKSLDTGVVDKQWEQVQLREAYEYAFKQRRSDLLNDIKFALPDEVDDEQLVGWNGAESWYDDFTNNAGPFPDIGFEPDLDGDGSLGSIGIDTNTLQDIERDDTQVLVNSFFAVDFDGIKVIEAIWQLNNQYQLLSWVDNDLNLWVGIPEGVASHHVAASDDDRVWKYRDVNITHPREPIKGAIVRGKWLDAPGFENDGGNVLSMFTSPKTGGTDVRVEGVAERNDVEDGTIVGPIDTKGKRNAVAALAKNSLKEEIKAQHSGRVEIDPSLSGDFTPFTSLSPGDLLHLVPSDKGFDNPTATTGTIDNPPSPETRRDHCGGFVYNEIYIITSLEHRLTDNGKWRIYADVSIYPADIMPSVESTVQYYDPDSDNSFDELEKRGFYRPENR